MASKQITITFDVTKILQGLARIDPEAITAAALQEAANRVMLQAMVSPGSVRVVRTRIVTRQSCLWRHSFDWHNRKRGHPQHRAT